jgi:hypothetical protein
VHKRFILAARKDCGFFNEFPKILNRRVNFSKCCGHRLLTALLHLEAALTRSIRWLAQD